MNDNNRELKLKLLKGFYLPKVNSKILHHIHLPKCGGTTIDHIFQKFAFNNPQLNFLRIKTKKNFPSDNENLKKILNNTNTRFYVSGHLQENYLDSITSDIFKFSVIRDPYQRLVSHYKFHLFKHELIPENFSMKDYIYQEYKLNRDNLLIRTFSNNLQSKIVIDDAIINIANKNLMKIHLLTNIENWNTFVNILISIFDLPNVAYTRYQEHKYSFSYFPSNYDMDLIKEAVFFDNEIYKKIFSENNIFYKDKNNLDLKRKEKNKYLIVSPLLYNANNNYLYYEKEFKKIIDKLKIRLIS